MGSARKAALARQQASRNEFLWRQDVRRHEQLQRDHLRDADAAETIRDKTEEKVKRIRDSADAEAQRVFEQVQKQFGAEEKKILSAPRTVFTGATFGINDHIIVWHWKTVMPDALRERLGVSRSDVGPIAALRVGGGFVKGDSAPDALVAEEPSLTGDPAFMDWATAVAQEWDAFARSYGSSLAKLRDDEWWAEICLAAGIAQTKSASEPITGTYGQYERKVTLNVIPTVSEIIVGASGLVLRVAHRAGDSAKTWVSKIDALRAALKSAGAPASGLSISEDSSGDVLLFFNDRDPFEGVANIESVFDAERGRSLIGLTAQGREAWITWNGSSGMMVGGVPGSGKTASMLPVFASMAGAGELYVFDGKGGYDLHPLRHIAAVYDRSGAHDAPLDTLKKLERLRVIRTEYLYEKTGINNFWNVPMKLRQQLSLCPIFVVLDECQVWLDTSGMNKEEKEAAGEITRLVRTLIQMGRAAGIVVVLTTQKPDANTLPTRIRDNAGLKLCFRVSTPEQAITVLGALSPGADPTSIPLTAKGRGVMELEHGAVMMQAGYVSAEELESRLQDAPTAPDQWEIASRLSGTKSASASHPDPADETSSRGRDSQSAEFDAPLPESLDLSHLTADQRAQLLRALLSHPVTAEESTTIDTGEIPL